ncbi:hypothetical protein E6H20_04425 [Candidatus Bathyarchaeota archaeon]|nr:MAG: hypothetical protein E6H20_04425 [Candidatus Bathyarchaeota archaeon]
MHFARSGIDTPLKVFSIFGVISGMLLISSLAYLALVVNLGPVDYNSQLAFLFFTMVGMAYGLLVIIGGLVVLSAPMNLEPRGVLAFFVFIASLFAIIGSFFLFSFVILGPQ